MPAKTEQSQCDGRWEEHIRFAWSGREDALSPNISGDGRRVSMRLPSMLVLYPEQRKVVPTGMRLEIPDGFVGMAISDGNLARERGVVVAGGTRIVAPGDTSEFVVTLQNLGRDPVHMEKGTRVFSLVLVPCPSIVLDEVESVGD